MRKLLFLVSVLVATQGFAESRYVDSASLYDCGGSVELRESKDNLHLKFEDVTDCDTLIVQTDRGQTLETYSFKKGGQRAPFSPSYTLSNEMWRNLGRGDLILKVRGGWFVQDSVNLRVNPWGTPDHDKPNKCGGHTAHNFTGFALTNTCKCAYYRNGNFERPATPRELSRCRK